MSPKPREERDLHMRFDVHLHIELPSEVMGLLGEMSRKLDLIISKENQIMSLETDALDQLEANTRAIDGAEESAEAAFLRLADLIAALKTNTTDPETARRILASSEALRARAARLGAAVEAAPSA